MKLLLDIGNTRIKWALLNGDELSAQQALAHQGLNAAQLRERVLQPCGAVHQVFVANVAGNHLARLVKEAVDACWGIEPVFATTAMQCGAVRNAYLHPERLGIDRWLALLGAYALAPSAACIVDIGTAMTIDVIDDTGAHRGGLIVPGPGLMMDSLMQRTSDIAGFAKWRSTHRHDSEFFANDTWDCVYQGAQHATAAVIDAAHAELAQLVGQAEPRLLLTGGAGDSILPLLHTPVQVVPDLVLRGLAAYASHTTTHV